MANQVDPTGQFLDLLNRFSLEQLEEERAKLRAQIAQLNTASQLLDLAINVRTAANGQQDDKVIPAPPATAGATGPAPTVGGRPRLKEAILGVMAEGADAYEWRPAEIHAALEARGWAPQTASARSQISNRLGDLVEAGQLRKPRPGHYRLVRGESQD